MQAIFNEKIIEFKKSLFDNELSPDKTFFTSFAKSFNNNQENNQDCD